MPQTPAPRPKVDQIHLRLPPDVSEYVRDVARRHRSSVSSAAVFLITRGIAVDTAEQASA